MQLGRLEQMDQSKVEHLEKISKIENVDKQHTIVPDERYKNIQNSVNEHVKNEVILDNVKFGFDKESNEFFVRIEKEGNDYQFPTEQILRMKAHLQESLDEQLKKS
ncbi:MAG TPA: flagellin [Arcobacter sp.]|jgi:hypothetical protein|nr:flagellin [Arcobacter sp.]